MDAQIPRWAFEQLRGLTAVAVIAEVRAAVSTPARSPVYAVAMVELVGNKAIEDAAIGWVIGLEAQAGRTAKDTRYRGAPADVESPPRLIEVKADGRSARGQELFLEVPQVEHAESTEQFFVYVVENVRQGDPAHFTLRVLDSRHLRRLLTRKKEQRYYTVPWPVGDYDSTPQDGDPADPAGNVSS